MSHQDYAPPRARHPVPPLLQGNSDHLRLLESELSDELGKINHLNGGAKAVSHPADRVHHEQLEGASRLEGGGGC